MVGGPTGAAPGETGKRKALLNWSTAGTQRRKRVMVLGMIILTARSANKIELGQHPEINCYQLQFDADGWNCCVVQAISEASGDRHGRRKPGTCKIRAGEKRHLALQT
jgi:hypothetical protein